MTKYKCGHESESIVMDNNIMSLSAYIEWVVTVGWNGDSSKCFDCWCKEMR